MNTKSRLEQLHSLLHEDPQDCFTRYAIALEHIKNNDLDKAQICFESLKTSDPEYLATYYQLGMLYARTEEFVKMRQILEQGLEVAKSQGDHHTYSEIKGLLQQQFDDEEF